MERAIALQAMGHGFEFHILHQRAQFAAMRVGVQRSSTEAGHLWLYGVTG